MALVSLAAVIAAELARLNVPGRHYRGLALPVLPLPRLRRLGREPDLSEPLPAVLDDETPALVLALLERAAVIELVSGARTVARVERLLVDGGDVRWRDVEPDEPRRRYAATLAPERPPARARQRAPRVRKRRSRAAPLPGIGSTEAARLAGVSTSAVHVWLSEGLLPCTVHVVGKRRVRRVLPADVLSMKKAPAAVATSA